MKKDANAEPCCPKIDPAVWDGKTHIWKDKLFLRDEVRQVFHTPLNLPKVVERMWDKIQKADAAVPMDEFLMLSWDPSPWKSELYINVAKEVPGAETVKLSGTFISKPFDGPFRQIPLWLAEMEKFVGSQGKKVLKHFVYCTTCPRCAKIYGHNYVIVFSQIE